MTVGLAASVLNALLDALGNATNYTAPTAVWVKLHTGDPGAAGTANAAANTTRQQASFAAASGAIMSTDADITWTNVPNTETYSHVSFWDASVAGSFIGSDSLTTPRAVAAGNNFVIVTNEIIIAMTPVAA